MNYKSQMYLQIYPESSMVIIHSPISGEELLKNVVNNGLYI